MVADKRSLHQIMLNLVSNAIKFTKRGGKITVSARVNAANVTVAVEDTGVGIGSRICHALAIRSSRRVPPTATTTAPA